MSLAARAVAAQPNGPTLKQMHQWAADQLDHIEREVNAVTCRGLSLDAEVANRRAAAQAAIFILKHTLTALIAATDAAGTERDLNQATDLHRQKLLLIGKRVDGSK